MRVKPHDGHPTGPLTASKLGMNDTVPWRLGSNSRRATRPGRSGGPGAARSEAWTGVTSSVLTGRSPWAARSGAAR